MCCFLVPLTQAIATSAYRKTNEKNIENAASPLKRHLPALEKTGGVYVMLREMLTVGLPMSLVLTAVWAVWAILKERREVKEVNVSE